MERREQWRGVGTALPTVTRRLAGMFIVQTDNQRLVAAFARREDYATAIDEHNQHATLVEQRDLLVAALRNLIRQLPSDERLADYNLDEAEAALATVEQGGES